MSGWSTIYERVRARVEQTELLYFRGHADASWELLPSIARKDAPRKADVEAIAYYDFVTRAGELVSAHASSWQTVFTMQHHGVPTRLLDWSESFGVALFFALRGAEAESAVWILDPFALNLKAANNEKLPRPEQLDADYADYFVDDQKEFDFPVLALSPLRHEPRSHRQRGGYTLHGDLSRTLDIICPSVVEKILIPRAAHAEARAFLQLAGISEFTLFPDLDGLARDIVAEHFPSPPSATSHWLVPDGRRERRGGGPAGRRRPR